MKVLIDECLPRDLKIHLTGHEARTVQEMGWSGTKNGQLMALAEQGFDVLLTIDQGFQYQQRQKNLRISIFILKAVSNKIEDLLPLVPSVVAALDRIREEHTSVVSIP